MKRTLRVFAPGTKSFIQTIVCHHLKPCCCIHVSKHIKNHHSYLYLAFIFQVELNKVSTVRGVVTQGRNVDLITHCCNERVTKFAVSYSIDGVKYEFVKDPQGNKQVYSTIFFIKIKMLQMCNKIYYKQNTPGRNN